MKGEENPNTALVLIGSSGESPYLEIEKFGQEQTFALDSEDIVFRWAEGDPEKRRKFLPRFINALVARHRELGKRKTIRLRPFAMLAKAEKDISSSEFRSGRNLRDFVIELDFSFFRLRGKIVNWVVRLLWPVLLGKSVRTQHKRRFRLRAPSSYHLSPMRAVEKLEIFLQHTSAPFLVATTSTCYVNCDALKKTLAHLPKERLYAGTILSSQGVPFVAGNNILMTRDVAAEVLKHKHRLRHDMPDDVALGFLIADMKIAKPLDIKAEELPLRDFSPSLLSPTWQERHIVRCKVSPRTRDSDEVISRLRQIHRLRLTPSVGT